MSFKDSRNQFKIVILSDSINNADAGAELKTTLAASGFESFLFFDSDVLIKNLSVLNPHFLVFDISALSETLNDFFTSVLTAAPDVRLVAISNAVDSEALLSYREYGLMAHVPLGENLVIRAAWELETLVESLFSEMTIKKLMESGLQEETPTRISSEVYPLNDALAAPNSEELVNLLFSYLGESAKSVYFKKVSSIGSYVPVQLKGVSELELKDETFINQSQVEASLKLKKWPHVEIYSFASGFLAVNLKLDEGQKTFLKLVSQLIRRFELQAETERLDIHDSSTGFLREDQLDKILVQESDRARRLRLPLSLVTFRIEESQKILSTVGVPGREIVLKTIYQLINKSCRVNDYAFRIGEDQIVLVLVHTSIKGALIRAERLRRAIDSHPFGIMGIKVFVATGVSEYPTVCGSMADLIESSRRSMLISSEHGAKSICVHERAPDYQPPFVVNEED